MAVMAMCALFHCCILVDIRSHSLRCPCRSPQQHSRDRAADVAGHKPTGATSSLQITFKVTNLESMKGSDHRYLVLAVQVGGKLSIDEKQHVFAELPVAFRSTSDLLAALAKTH